ncbi:hypothetical protein WM40_06325 [Robbsia andropogonis]|uniref:Uncharacterized protein n=1 Tax=Robbsia andropogonis TaxID=28092 RepID=A0A0F5K317_9BURK|nr:hypothetical protein [Robbsia andropogonis]KKB64488.1 hypothetical protein WM40_06325 [Robbsia andropogonis]
MHANSTADVTTSALKKPRASENRAVPYLFHYAWEGGAMPPRFLANILSGYDSRFVSAIPGTAADVASLVAADRIIWTTRPALIQHTLDAMSDGDSDWQPREPDTCNGLYKALTANNRRSSCAGGRLAIGESALQAFQKQSVYRYLARTQGHRLVVRDAEAVFDWLVELWRTTPPLIDTAHRATAGRNRGKRQRPISTDFVSVAMDLKARFHREISGPYANMAAASDLTRLVVLYLFGGHWRDVDVVEANGGDIDAPRGLRILQTIVGTRDPARLTANGVLAAAPHSPRVAALLLAVHAAATRMDQCHLTTWGVKRSDLDMWPDQTKLDIVDPEIEAETLSGDVVRHMPRVGVGAWSSRLFDTLHISGPERYVEEGMGESPHDQFPHTWRWFSDAAHGADVPAVDLQDPVGSAMSAASRAISCREYVKRSTHGWARTPHEMLFPKGLVIDLDASAAWQHVRPKRSARGEWP